MTTGHAPVRQLDHLAIAELTHAVRHVHADTRTCANRSDPLPRVARAAARLSAATRAYCRPVDTDHGLYVLRGLQVDDTDIGVTPASWATAGDSGAFWDLVLLLLASAMGRPMAWEGQQGGRFVHNIVPAPGREREQTGASSEVLLSPHTEDAFHPGRAHLLLLGCLRNHDAVATTAASVRRARLTEADVTTLCRAELPILPDDAYTRARGLTGSAPAVPTLWRDEQGPALRFDPAYTPLERASDTYRAAYRRLAAELERVSTSVSLSPGEVLVLDNDLVVHGRAPFTARYDGTDRWLKRASVRVPGRRTRPVAENREDGYGHAVLEAYDD
ncbi:TauD/TfdA family dioxygenase [Streptomyces sp. NPDC057702]|uniref:TauD/TfdA family dioxygenase n=1 Tax=unclassified Streptomyces TaxID=2593676 RepID=UPI00368783B3